MAVGPCSRLSSIDTPASAAARLVRVFLTTAYVVSRPRAWRRSVICLTVRPRYSVMTAADEDVKCSVISATALTFSVFGTCLPPLVLVGPVVLGRGDEKRPGAGRTGRYEVPNRPTCAGRSGAPEAFGRTRACDDQRSSGGSESRLRDRRCGL